MPKFPANWGSVKLFERLKLALFRGNKMFLSFGALYIRAPELDHEILEAIQTDLATPPAGQAFLRWGRKTRAPHKIALLVTGIGRLGNSVIQVLNIRALAAVLKAPFGLYHRFDAIRNTSLELTPGITLRKIPAFRSSAIHAPRIIWRTYALDSEIPLTPPCDSGSSPVREALRTVMVTEDVLVSPSSQESLTVYLRSGDVFSGHPEPHYGQPPWAFYERVLEFKEWASVELIAEDRANPNYELIVNWCQERGIGLSETGGTLDEAIRSIVKSRNLVSARGTFVPSLVYLSDGPKVIFQFHDERNPLMCREELTLWRVSDHEGDYVSSVMSRNWENSAAQRALMVSYPKTSLSDVTKDVP